MADQNDGAKLFPAVGNACLPGAGLERQQADKPVGGVARIGSGGALYNESFCRIEHPNGFIMAAIKQRSYRQFDTYRIRFGLTER